MGLCRLVQHCPAIERIEAHVIYSLPPPGSTPLGPIPGAPRVHQIFIYSAGSHRPVALHLTLTACTQFAGSGLGSSARLCISDQTLCMIAESCQGLMELDCARNSGVTDVGIQAENPMGGMQRY